MKTNPSLAPEFLRTAATNEHILAACERHMGLKSERGTFKPYMVICDGTSTFLKTAKALMNFISTVAQGEVCRVFRNAGHGATIDFDNIKSPTSLVIGGVQEGPAITAARAALGVYPAPPSPAAPTQPKIMGRDWEEIQAMQQGQNVTKLPPVDTAKMKAAILSDVARFKIPVAVEVVNELEIELPASYKLIGGTWIHSEDSAPAAPCPSASHLPLIAPVGVSGQELAGVFQSAGNNNPECKACGQSIHRHTDEHGDLHCPAPVSPSLPAPSVRYFASSLMGRPSEYSIDIMREITTEHSVTTGLYCALECTRMPGELEAEAARLVAVLNGGESLKADVERLTGAVKMALTFENERRAGIKHSPSDYSELHSKLTASLSLAEVGKH